MVAPDQPNRQRRDLASKGMESLSNNSEAEYHLTQTTWNLCLTTRTSTVEDSGPATTDFGQTLAENTPLPMDGTMLEAPEPFAAVVAKLFVSAKQYDTRSLLHDSNVPRDVHQVNISRSEVVYPPGAAHLNAGEILPSGVSSMIASIHQIGAIGAWDVFLDIGSGVGNIVVQFVLSTAVRSSIGIEIRRDLVGHCNGILSEHVVSWPRLQNADIYAQDVKKIDLSTKSPFTSATIVLANNLRFDPSATNHIADQLACMPDARVAALTSAVCPRHNSICTKHFCRRWKLRTCVHVNVSWTSSEVPIYIFVKRGE
ncbi:Histone methylation protein DOT1 [Phytophthora infestans]|uniref:Histone-lysine N-methyltransferase, H3 lysine-79 specific n=1 Tax=Phytophthora infestans TaxID=4787 RepID=A0A8S9URL7_PHYIN|nr:Histone methylation protein DOT1 [Phytophthora infestans]